jgi:hypothetical protein
MKSILSIVSMLVFVAGMSQSPEITSWLINSTGVNGSHYVNNNPTAIQDNVAANVQSVEYSDDWVYVRATGIPSYTTGPFLDGNPSLATNQNAIFRITRHPLPPAGVADNTTGGNIGIFINGVALFDYRDGVAWNPATNALCGGPGNPPCPGGPGATMDWNRDAILAERGGFDCAKGHPAMGNYHHHQNPSAFDLDLVVISDICSIYDADGLYVIDSTAHSPLIGFAYDGYPIYGAYGFANEDGTGGVVRMKSGYVLRNIIERTTNADGQSVQTGPAVGAAFPLGYFREDYAFDAILANAQDVLDEHNGRFCITPEYPEGTYCYFATVDENWNSAYPYVVGPQFYGDNTGSRVNSVNETTQTYDPSVFVNDPLARRVIHVYPNPSSEYIAIQTKGLVRSDLEIEIYSSGGQLIQTARINQGSTLDILDISRLYPGTYCARIKGGNWNLCESFVVIR